jgi:hypothetical protein
MSPSCINICIVCPNEVLKVIEVVIVEAVEDYCCQLYEPMYIPFE